MKKIVLTLLSVAFGLLSAFFCYYTLRLIYVNVAVAGAAAHRQTGMYIGAVAFPVATVVFGWLSVWCVRRAKS